MTLGEHIQTLRKARGLSQEALGEALGVTRQSISKWESDLAMPEVEKLIAMSRLFEVSVGALLQVEEPARPGDVPEELNEREWKAVEAIVSKYVEEMSRTGARPARKRWPGLLLAGVVAVVSISLFARMSSLTNQLGSLQGNLNYLSSTVSGQIGDLTGQMKDILDRQNRVAAASSYEVAGVGLEDETITFTLSAMPREYTPGMTAEFSAALEDGSVVTAPGTEAGRQFTAQLTCPLSDVITLSVSFLNGPSVQNQLLGVEEGWLSDHRPQVWGYGGIPFGYVLGTNGYMHLSACTLTWEAARVKTAQGVQTIWPSAAEVMVYVNAQQVGETVHGEIPEADGARQHGEAEIGLDATLFLQEGDEVLILSDVTDSVGRTERCFLGCWKVEENHLYPVDESEADMVAPIEE